MPAESRRSSMQKRSRRDSLRPSPKRDAIVDAMRAYGKPISKPQVATITGLTRNSASYHMRTLADAGVIKMVGEGDGPTLEHFFMLARPSESLIDPAHALLALAGALTVSSDEGYPVAAIVDDEAQRLLSEVRDELMTRVREIVTSSTRRAQGAGPPTLGAVTGAEPSWRTADLEWQALLERIATTTITDPDLTVLVKNHWFGRDAPRHPRLVAIVGRLHDEARRHAQNDEAEG
jgi:DNA-binding transcriptional ArsR family regulator